MMWHEIKTKSLADILTWAQSQPWAQAMSACGQDAEWHSEGDVWTHTKMVCRQLPDLDQWSELDRNEQLVLIFTALFHDSGKPLTTEVDPSTGRVRSPYHAVRGEHIARCALRELACDLGTREQICQLVRHHGRPAFLAERENPNHEVIKLSWLVQNRLLYLFALADTRGRITTESNRPEENLHYWRLTAEELGCYKAPYPFATDHARWTYFRQAEPNVHYVPHDDLSCTVTMMSGLPGSGKDTYLATHLPDTPVVSLDEIRGELDVDPLDNQGEVAQVAKERCRVFLRAKTSFAFNATNLLQQTRLRWLDLFADYQARVELVYVEPPFGTILAQNKNRSHEQAVPEAVIRKLATKVEPPTWLECHRRVLANSAAKANGIV
jgi:predicted kinase